MGQAKNRGTREQRVLEGIQKKAEREAQREAARIERQRADAAHEASLPVAEQQERKRRRRDGMGLLSMAAAMSATLMNR